MIVHLVFPTNLYSNNHFISNDKKIIVLEEKINFTYLPYHKLKLVLHRSSMKKYFDSLKVKNKKYVEFHEDESSILHNISELEFVYPNDHLITEKWIKLAKKHKVHLTVLPPLTFLITLDEIKQWKAAYYHDRIFYPYMRRKLDVLMTKNDKPVGGQFSFDKENRKALDIKPPTTPTVKNGKYIVSAKKYVEKHFPDNYGSTGNFIYPIDKNTATKWLKEFVEKRLKYFGPYEDALDEQSPIIFHSCLAVSLNIGLLTDKEVLDYVLENSDSIPLNSLEGFVRQLIGWRNYVFLIYEKEGEKIRTMNFFHHHRRLSNRWWLGQTQIPIVDTVINKVTKYAYAHHIERLMILGNFMLLCGIEPIEVNNWFQAFVSIDAYDVFMIPNVLGMSQHADGGLTMTRPYFSSSNYIKKMLGKTTNEKVVLNTNTYDWDVVWDAVYYTFIDKHYNYLKKNYSTSRQVAHWDKKTNKSETLKIAKLYLDFIETDT